MFTQVSDKFKELMSSNRGQMSTELEIRIDPGASTPTRIMIYQDDIVSIDYHGASCEDHIAVGTFVLPTLTVRIKASCQEMQDIFNYNINLKGAEIRWNVLLKDETMQEPESAQVCILTIKRISPTADGENVNITAESKYVGKIDTVYAPTITFPSNASAVLDDIAAQLVEYYGNVLVGIDRTRVSNFHIESIPARATFRDVLRSIAEYNGLFVTIDRDDIMIMFIWYGTVLHDPDYEIFKVSKDCCSDVQLAKVDEGYNGLVCPTATQVVTEGDAPFLALENRCKMFDYYPQRVSEIQERICEIKCRTGRVSMALGNILFDPWDMLKIEPDIRHNLLTCGLASTTVSGVSITRNNDGTYFLNGVATDLISISMQSNDLPAGNYIMRSNIVDPSGNADDIMWYIHGTYDRFPLSEADMRIEYDTAFSLPIGIAPSLPCDHHTLDLMIPEGASFNNVLIRPMITAAEDDYDQYEVYQADQLFPVSQIDHQYDGGLRTVITIPEITQNDDGTVEYTGGDSEVEADIAALAAQIGTKADKSTVTALAATVATKADAATVGGQIAELFDQTGELTDNVARLTDAVGLDGSINLYPIDKGVLGDPVIYDAGEGEFAVMQADVTRDISSVVGFSGTSDDTTETTAEYRTFFNWGYRWDDNPFLFGDLVPGDYVLSFDVLDESGFSDVADFYFEIYEKDSTDIGYGDKIATCTGSNAEFTVTAAKPLITILAVAKRHAGYSWNGADIWVSPFLRRKIFATATRDEYQQTIKKQLAELKYIVEHIQPGGSSYNETQTERIHDAVEEV